GLDKYLFNEGFALRLLPKVKRKITENNPISDTEEVNTEVMYTNLMKNFNWANMKTASYLDPESTKMVFLSVNKFNELARNLIYEGKIDSARNVMEECLKVLPITTTYDSNFALGKYEIVDILYQLGMKQQASGLLKQTKNLIAGELKYHYSLIKNSENLGMRDIQLGLFVLAQFNEITKEHGETQLNKEVDLTLREYEKKFGMSR